MGRSSKASWSRMRPKQNKPGKTKGLSPKDQADDGSKCIGLKKGTWELVGGLLENVTKALNQKVTDGTQQERTSCTRRNTLSLHLRTLSLLSLSPTHACADAHACTP